MLSSKLTARLIDLRNFFVILFSEFLTAIFLLVSSSYTISSKTASCNQGGSRFVLVRYMHFYKKYIISQDGLKCGFMLTYLIFVAICISLQARDKTELFIRLSEHFEKHCAN